MKRILVPLADGCEELEAITLTDLFMRAGAEVVRAGLKPGEIVAGRGTRLLADTTVADVQDERFDLIALPGGMPGADHLSESAELRRLLIAQTERNGWIGAICAAPRALATAGLLAGRRVTSFPGALDGLAPDNCRQTGKLIEIDDHLVTAKGPGVALEFALTLIEQLWDARQRQAVEDPLQRK